MTLKYFSLLTLLACVLAATLPACAPAATLGAPVATSSAPVATFSETANTATGSSSTMNSINAARAQGVRCGDGSGGKRLPNLIWEAKLAPIALGHARNMENRKIISHQIGGLGPRDRVAKSGYKFLRLSEIIYQGSGSRANAGEAVRWWLNSPVHCHAIMNPYYTRIGVGISGGSYVALLAQPN